MTSSWRAGSIGAAIAVLLGIVFWACPTDEAGLNGIARLSYDIPFAIRPRIVPTNSGPYVIYMDQQSHADLHQDPENVWSRSLHTELLKRLTTGGAKAAVFDVIFDRGSNTNQTDQALAKAMHDNGRVILAAGTASASVGGVGTMNTALLPDEPFRSAAGSYGFVDLPEDNDRGLRTHPEHRYPGLAWQAAVLLGGNPGDPGAKRYINYYGRHGTVPSLSYVVAHNTNLLENAFFKDKIFLIGLGRVMTAKGENMDVHRTPFTRWTGEDWPGVEIQATILLNLLRGDWLNRMGYGTEFLLLVATGCSFGFGLVFTRPWTAGVVALCGSLGMAVLAFVLWWHQRIWFSWLIPSAIQIPCALGWAIFSTTTRTHRPVGK